MRNEYSTLDIVKALEIPRERLRDWMSREFIIPSVQSEGQGTKAIFTRYDIYGIALFKKMVESGLSRTVAGDWVNNFISREKDGTDGQKTDIIKLIVTLGGESFSESIVSQDWFVDLSTGMTAPNPKKLPHDINPLSLFSKMKEQYSKKWDVIILINFKNLRDEVDNMLNSL